MTIRKGEEWGRRITAPDVFRVAEDDADLASQGNDVAVALRRGDLHRALGEPALTRPGSECTVVQIDALLCRITSSDGLVSERFASSSVSIGSWWTGEFIVVSNSGFYNGLNIAPRSHPNDGAADIVTIEPAMTTRQRFIARRRARTGTHLPHPQLSVSRATGHTRTRRHRRERLSLDGRAVADWESIDISVVADHWTLLL